MCERKRPVHGLSDGDSVAAMSDTDTDTGPAPIFSADDGIEKLWEQAYQGEVLGETFFSGVADRLDNAEQVRKMRVLAELERRTKEAVAPAVTRAGVSAEPDAEMVSLAEALATDSANRSWGDLMVSIGTVTDQFIPLYQRIGELDPSELEAADLLVAHEVALRDFTRAELAGDVGTSLDPVHALGHMH
jgi:hypothetical protein